MNRNRLNAAVYLLLLVGLFITLFIVYKDIDSPFAFSFIIGYLIFLFLSVCYFFLLLLWRARRVERKEIRSRLSTAGFAFGVMMAMQYGASMIFGWAPSNWLSGFFTTAAISFSFAFADLLLGNQSNN